VSATGASAPSASGPAPEPAPSGPTKPGNTASAASAANPTSTASAASTASPASTASASGTAGPGVARIRLRRRPSGEPPPLPRDLHASGRWWLILLGLLALAWAVLATSRIAVPLDVADHRIVGWFSDLRTPALTSVMRVVGALATAEVLTVLWWATLAVLLIWRRWRHLLVWIGAMTVVQVASTVPAEIIQRPRPIGVEILGDWEGFSMPSRPMAVLAAVLVNGLYSVVPSGRLREIGKIVTAVALAAVALSRVYLAQDNPSDALVGAVLGVALPLAAFRLFTPSTVFPVRYKRGRTAHLDLGGMRGEAIERALQDQLGVIPVEVKPFGLAGSGGSTPMRIRVKGEPELILFAKLYAKTHLRSDRWYKLGRTLLYGRLEDEKAFNTVRRLVQYEDYLMRLMRDAGLPVPKPYGIVEITPEREYLLVTEFFDGAREIGEAEVDDDIIDQGLRLVRRLWEAGLAHRDIKPANVMVRDGRLLLIDTAFGEVRPSPWRQAVDLGNMMLVLALRTDPQRVYDHALRLFSVDEIAEAFAATRGLTMPSQLRGMMRQLGRDLHAEFVALLPYRPQPIRIQRWSVRRISLILTALAVGLVAALVAVELLGSPL
jgi:tRNA A-37 threonylcarbamoyl transferase component Bud32/membrane-associated phospholipid phosphatase